MYVVLLVSLSGFDLRYFSTFFFFHFRMEITRTLPENTRSELITHFAGQCCISALHEKLATQPHQMKMYCGLQTIDRGIHFLFFQSNFSKAHIFLLRSVGSSRSIRGENIEGIHFFFYSFNDLFSFGYPFTKISPITT